MSRCPTSRPRCRDSSAASRCLIATKLSDASSRMPACFGTSTAKAARSVASHCPTLSYFSLSTLFLTFDALEFCEGALRRQVFVCGMRRAAPEGHDDDKRLSGFN